jgi:hypothetical protein
MALGAEVVVHLMQRSHREMAAGEIRATHKRLARGAEPRTGWRGRHVLTKTGPS